MDLADCAVDTAGVFCSWVLEGLDGKIENRSTRQRLTWPLSAFRHEGFGTMCTIRYRSLVIQYAEDGLDIWQISQGDISATNWSFWRGWAE
jgi:hypothetical protein